MQNYFWENANKVFLAAATEKIEAVITAKSLTDIYYLSHRYTHDDKKTRDIILKLLELFKLADTAADDCINALASEVPDYEDAVMIESAVRICADYIVTRNIRGYQKSPIPVILPEEFILAFEKN
ncbi:MAG: PIN domain-containing protein [Firmicutes bacterium]|nr:PIN domain-containing protein [Bacillota bacterium]